MMKKATIREIDEMIYVHISEYDTLGLTFSEKLAVMGRLIAFMTRRELAEEQIRAKKRGSKRPMLNEQQAVANAMKSAEGAARIWFFKGT